MNERGDREGREHTAVSGNLPRIALSAPLDHVADSRVPRGTSVARQQIRRNEKRHERYRPAPSGRSADYRGDEGGHRSARRERVLAPRDDGGEYAKCRAGERAR
jgi:hypothetical protein